MRTETLNLAPAPGVPNNPGLPVIVYHEAIARDDATPEAFEGLFRGNLWGQDWRDGIFPYHHFHPKAHEVLGIARGRVRVCVGGPGGSAVALEAGDVVLLPAGTGHKRIAASADLIVVGAYPAGQDARIVRAGAGDPRLLLRQIAAVGLPERDPVAGAGGPATRLWA